MAPSQRISSFQSGEFATSKKRHSYPLNDAAFLADLSMDFPRRHLLESVAEDEDAWSDVAATDPGFDGPCLSVCGSMDFKRDCMPAYVAVRTLKDYRRCARFPSDTVAKLDLFKSIMAEQDPKLATYGMDAANGKLRKRSPQSEPGFRPPPGLLDILNGDNTKTSSYCPPSPSPERIQEFIHDLSRRSTACKDASQDDNKTAEPQASVVLNLSEMPLLHAALAVAKEPKQDFREESEPEPSVSEQSISRISKKTVADYISLRYNQNANVNQQGSPASLTLVAGASVRMPAFVDIDAGKQGALENHIKFAVRPALPAGLILCKRTGLISGVPNRVQESPSTHQITISIPAMGPNGTSLGRLPLTSCTLVVRIIDLSNYVQSPSVSTHGEGGTLVLRLRKSCPPDKMDGIE